jgi:hypothetical protein
VAIAKGSKPKVRLVPIARGGFSMGLLKGQVGKVPDFFGPMEEEDLEAWEGGR